MFAKVMFEGCFRFASCFLPGLNLNDTQYLDRRVELSASVGQPMQTSNLIYVIGNRQRLNGDSEFSVVYIILCNQPII